MKKNPVLDNAAKSLFIISVIVIALYFLGNVLMPIIFAGLASIICLPIALFFERIGLNKGISAIITVLLISLVIVGVLIVIIIQSQEIVQELPKLMDKNEDFLTVKNLPFISENAQSYVDEHIDIVTDNLEALKSALLSLVEGSFNGLKNTLLFLISCPIYILFMLIYRNNIFRFIEAYHVKEHDKGEGKKIIEKVKKSLYDYLKGLLLVMLVIGVLTSIGLLLLGINNALFFGIVAALLAPIPYIGVIISALIPTILALLTKDSGWYAFGVIAVFSFVQFIEGNFITPRIMGNNININPLIILLSIVIFGSIAGILGIILTVPLLAVIKVILSHYPKLKPWTYLIEDEKSD
ncbi:MAG: AI-2E family transporter [Brumimicrobium sp.]